MFSVRFSARNVLSNYSPLFTMVAVILGMFAMATCIGLGMNLSA